ncbi:MAG: peptidoglycan recognition protein family protein [Elusimicrobiota bacterium]
MWKKPAAASIRRSAVFLAAALALVSFAGGRARADGDDVTEPAVFSGGGSTPLFLPPHFLLRRGILYRSAPSRAFLNPWDTILIEGIVGGPNVLFEFSKQIAGGWSPWVSAQMHVYANGRFWGKAGMPMGDKPLRFRIVAEKNGASSSILISNIGVYDSSSRWTSSETAPQNIPEPVLPPLIHARREWHAKPSKNPYIPQTPERITIHHTAGPQTMTLKDTLQEVRFIQDFQQNGRGWDDIGYHFLIDGAGNIIEGRPVNVVGSHVKGHNVDNVGIAMMGYFTPPVNDHLTRAQLNSLVDLVRYLSLRYKIPVSKVRGHRDYEATQCPGNNVYDLLPQIRAAASLPPLREKPILIKRPPVLPILKLPAWDGRGVAP